MKLKNWSGEGKSRGLGEEDAGPLILGAGGPGHDVVA